MPYAGTTDVAILAADLQDDELRRLRRELELARPLVAIANGCYEATRALQLHSTEESDELWEAAEQMMRTIAEQRSEEWKILSSDVAKNTEEP